MAGIVSWILIILGNIGIMIWLGTAKGVTTIQSSYAALSGPEYVAYWNLYYQVSDLNWLVGNPGADYSLLRTGAGESQS